MKNRDEVKKYLADNEVSSEIYYPVSFHQQECFSNLNYKKGDFPFAENATETSLAIPIYPDVSKEQIAFVVEKIKESVN